MHTRNQGGRLKVVESSGIHQDHILAVGGAALLLQERENNNLTIFDASSDSGYLGGRSFHFDKETERVVYDRDDIEPDDVEEGWDPRQWERIA